MSRATILFHGHKLKPGRIDDPFNTVETPVAFALINDIGGVISKSTARARGIYEGNKALWDAVPELSYPSHNKIYNPHGVMPDVAAQQLYDAGLIKDPYADTMWSDIQAESKHARERVQQQRHESVGYQRQAYIAEHPSDDNGVWRTINGHHIFIRNGALSSPSPSQSDQPF